MEDWPGLQVFISADPRGSSQSVANLYKKRDLIQGVEKKLDRTKDPEERRQIKQLNRDLLLQKGRINRTTESLKRNWRRVNSIYAHEKMTPAEKRVKLDAEYEKIVFAARRAQGLE